jgi:DDE superfamily endonuclease
MLDPARMMFIDETWTKTNITRLYGWAEVGHRLVDAVPHGHWNTSTFIADLRRDGLVAPCVFDGAINGEAFLAYVEQVLAPTLRTGDIVIMDRLGSPRLPAFVRRSRHAAPRRSTCRRTAPTSTRLSRSSPSSKLCCAPELCEPSTHSGKRSALVHGSRPPNMLTSSVTLDISTHPEYSRA